MKSVTPPRDAQKKFDFSPSQPRPFVSRLPAGIDTYEEGVARFFQWRTGLDYYVAMDQIVDFVVSMRKLKVVDLLTDTATFALRLAGRKAFPGRIYSYDTNVTLLERAKQRALHLDLQQAVEFRHFQEPSLPIPDGFADLAVSVFDLHRHPAEQYLAEAFRILAPEGNLIVADLLEPKSGRRSLSRIWRRIHLQFIQKNFIEARAVYYDREEVIGLFFKAGFQQVLIQGLNVPASPHSGVFSLIAATK
ncbi:MAG: methyltransferase domain-containing protein [Acidobacteria bacterium]|nr:methyltransferase domain-containing protein [Acidobacteriota bacterium]